MWGKKREKSELVRRNGEEGRDGMEGGRDREFISLASSFDMGDRVLSVAVAAA